jgi:single-strand DNA-binding protein
MNSIEIVGNLARQAELTTTSTGKKVAKTSIASDRSRSKDSKTDFIPLEGWDSVAEQLASFPQGAFVRVKGSLHVSQYEKDGQKRTGFTVTVRSLEVVERAAEAAQAAPAAEHNEAPDEYAF